MPRQLSLAGLVVGAALVGFFLGSAAPRSAAPAAGPGRPQPGLPSRDNPSSADSPVGGAPAPASDRETFIAGVRRIGAAPSSAQRYDELRKLLTAWALVDAKAALGYVCDYFPKDRQEQLLPEMLVVWAKNDPRSAWDWVSHTAPASLTQLTLFDAVLSETGKTDATLAWTLATGVASQRPFDAQSIYVSALRGILYMGDYASATRLLGEANLPRAEGRYDLTSLIASDWGRYEPEKAASWLLTLPAGFDRRQALISLSQSWSTVNAQAAADFAAQLPPSAERQAMLTTAVDSWVTDHPSQVGEWMLRYKQSPDFDQVITAVASSVKIIDSNVRTSIEWADTISDYDLRLQTLAKIMDHWISSDAESAHNYLLTTRELPLETRNDLRKRLRLD